MTDQVLSQSKPIAKPAPEQPALLPFHPAANVFDLMTGAEFDELVGDIKRRGLLHPIVIFDGQVVDGRNRILACAKAGVAPRYEPFIGTAAEVIRFIISANIHRRHLKPEQRKAHLKALLEGNPEKSDRAIAAEAGVSHTTVQNTRKATGNQLPVGGKRTGRDGRTRSLPKKKTPSLATEVAEFLRRHGDEFKSYYETPPLHGAKDIDEAACVFKIQEIAKENGFALISTAPTADLRKACRRILDTMPTPKTNGATAPVPATIAAATQQTATDLGNEIHQLGLKKIALIDDIKVLDAKFDAIELVPASQAIPSNLRIRDLENEISKLKTANADLERDLKLYQKENAELKKRLSAWQVATGADQPVPGLEDRWT